MSQPILQVGSIGALVTLLQQALNLGESALAALDEDGIFGWLTHHRVVEFQQQSSLTPDGVVGPDTYNALVSLYQMLAQLTQPTPAAAGAAQQNIVATAQAAATFMGWADANPAPPDPLTGRIAAKYGYGDDIDGAGSQLRVGGLSLATIFQMAGEPAAASICLRITSAARSMYRNIPEPTAEQRKIDLPEWCGIFVLYIYKVCGLKMSGWRTRPFQSFGGSRQVDPVLSVGQLEPGDFGVLSPFDGGRNHHFLIVGMNATRTFLRTVDGNAGAFQTILPRSYAITSMKPNDHGAFTMQTVLGNEDVIFGRPRWSKVL